MIRQPAPYFKHLCVVLLVVNMFACKHNKQTPVKNTPVAQKSSPATVPDKKGDRDLKSLLHVTDKEIQHNALYKFSNDWYGTPYKYGGCSKKGVDCSCFAGLLYQEVYSKTLAHSASEIFKASDELSIQDAHVGDLVFFKIGGRNISHVGVLVKGNYFIHASTSKGVMVSSLEEAYFKKYFFCAGRLKKV